MKSRRVTTVASPPEKLLLSMLLHVIFLNECGFPTDPLQIEYKNRVEDRDQQQGDEGRDGESAHLGVAEGFPERAAFESERKQSKDRGGHSDHHRSNTLNPGIRKSALQGPSLFVNSLDEVADHHD